jgi:hypothetical protein
MGQRIDLEQYQGDTWNIKFTLTDSEGEPWTGLINAQAVTFAVKKNIDDTNVLFTATATNGQNGSDFGQGIIIIIVPAESTSLLKQTGRYDLEVIKQNGTVKSPCWGFINLIKEVNPSI